jgi:hypothetical protein
MAALLLMGVVAVLPLTNSAFAQTTGTTITTSADPNGARFFGPAFLEVLISVSSHASDTSPGNLPVTVTAFGAAQTYQLTETGTTSGLFLMYIKVDPDVTTVEQPAAPITPFSATHTKLLIGTGAPAAGYTPVAPVQLTVAPANIVEGGSVQIAANGVTKTVTWDDSASTLTLDRTAYGPAGTIIAQIKEQDANLDPTRAETITEAVINTMLAAGGDAPTATASFVETGPNTATFELATLSAGALSVGVDSVARALTENDYKAFSQAIASGPITPASSAGTFGFATTVQGTSTGSYTVQTVRGTFQTVNATTYATELPLRIDDLDRNTSTRSEQAFTGAIRVTVANAAAGAPGSITNPFLFNIKELSLNSNTFKPSHSGDDIDVTPGTPLLNTGPGLAQQVLDQNAGVLRVQPGNDIVVEYLDAFYLVSNYVETTAVRLDINGDGDTTDTVTATVSESAIRVDLNADGDVADTTGLNGGLIESNTRVDLNGDGDFNDSVAVAGVVETTAARININGDADSTDTVTAPGPVTEATINVDLNADGDLGDTVTGLVENQLSVDLNGIDLDGVSSRLTFQIGNTAPTLTADKTTASKGSTVTYTLTDADLNDDTAVIESYTFNFNSGIGGLDTDFQATATPRVSAPAVAGNAVTPIYDARIRVSGSALDIASTFALTFTETGANTGVFTATLNLQTFTNAVGNNFPGPRNSFVDGDNIELTLKDVEDQTQAVFTEIGRTVQIGLTKPTVTLDRTTVGVPRVGTGTDANDGALAIPKNAANLGNVIIGITIVDPSANTNSQTEETLISSQAAVATDANGVLTLGNKLRLSLQTSSGGTFGGAGSIQVSESIRETGFDTGVFIGEIQVLSNPAETPAQWIGSKMKVEYAGQDNTFGNTDDADTTSVGFTARNAILSTDVTTLSNGQKILITVRDDDANRDVTSAEKVRVSIRWVDDTGATQFQTQTMDETGANTGIFTKSLTAGTSIIGGMTFRLQPDQDMRIRYYDLTPSVIGSSSWPLASSTQTQIDITVRAGAATGGLTVTPEQVGPATQLKVSITDIDLNANPSSKQTVTGRVTVVTDRGAGSRADLNVDETGPNTAVFEGKVRLNPAQAAGAANSPSNDVTINGLPGDVGSVRYEDEKGANGQRTTVTKTFQIVSVDPKMNFSKASYNAGEVAELTINDLDANRDPDTADILTVRATSTTDAVGLTNVQAIETGANTGVFRAIVQTSSQFSTGVLQVRNGDNITVEYEDAFPANFRQKFDANGTLAGSTQKFRVNTVIGVQGTTGSTTPSAPALANVDGSTVTEVTTGQQVVITSNVQNNDDQARPATVIVEVRDAEGITVYLQWQTATIAANGEIQVGLSWIPEDSGDYTIRTFVVSNLSNPQVLSEVVDSEITVS